MTTKSSWEKDADDSADYDDDDLVALDTVTVVDAGAFDCGVCYLPFKPPIFQCTEGHAVCSPCREKLLATGHTRCHVCRVDLAAAESRGYLRSHSLERMVESIRVPCRNAARGCAARLAYYDRSRSSHGGGACPHARHGCSRHGCGFVVGSAQALLDHIAGAHSTSTFGVERLWAAELSRLVDRRKLATAAADIGPPEVDPRDIQLVMRMAGVSSVDVAARAFKESGRDVITAIMDLTND